MGPEKAETKLVEMITLHTLLAVVVVVAVVNNTRQSWLKNSAN